MGYKFYCVCDPQPGYFIDYLLYIGQGTVKPVYGLTVDVVHQLVTDATLEGSGVTLIADNYYASPKLVAILAAMGIRYIGTCQLARKCFPRNLLIFPKSASEDNRGKIRAASLTLNAVNQSFPNLKIVAVAWKDNQVTDFVGSANSLEKTQWVRKTGKGGKRLVDAPMIAKVYSDYMGGVDRGDQSKVDIQSTSRCRP